jgi:hypothetical protein
VKDEARNLHAGVIFAIMLRAREQNMAMALRRQSHRLHIDESGHRAASPSRRAQMKTLERWGRSVACLLFLVASWATSAAPHALVARYQVGYNGFSAEGMLRVAPSATGRWLVSLRMGNLLAHLEQATAFDIVAGRMRPLGNSRIVETPLGRKTVVARFDWRSARVTWSGDAKPNHRGPVVLQAGDVDPLLFQLAVADDLAAGRPARYRVLENGRARLLAYRPLRSEPIAFAGRTRVASKLFASEGRKRYVIWVVPGLPVPVRLLQSEVGGDTIDMRLLALE